MYLDDDQAMAHRDTHNGFGETLRRVALLKLSRVGSGAHNCASFIQYIEAFYIFFSFDSCPLCPEVNCALPEVEVF
jgi:hypothetical protein